MPLSAPRIDERLLSALEELDDPDRPIAETNRRVGELAAACGLKRPSYEQIRTHVHQLRLEREHARQQRELLLSEVRDLFLKPRGPETVSAQFLNESRLRGRRRR